MKLAVATLITLLQQSLAFTPTPCAKTFNVRSITFKHSAFVDPSIFTDAHQHVDSISNFFSSITLSDGDVANSISTLNDAAPATASTVVEAISSATSDVAQTASDAAAATTTTDNGWFGFLEGPIEFLLKGIHSGLMAAGLSENSWGIAIIAMTCFIKLVTYPLTKSQLESNSKMQALQPMIKGIQAKYQSNPEVMNQKIAAVYQENQVNPLAGCIPSLVQIPVFVGLYRAVLNLAAADKLDEPFLWLPNLEGPTYGADPSSASSWLFSGWVNGAPALGWEDTLAFLSIPLVLIISQSISMNLMASKDQEQPAFIKFLPLLIGWFSLNVPAALGIYWVANNFITTALTLQIKSGIQVAAPVEPGSGAAATSVIDVQPTFTPAPMREKPAGFGASVDDDVDSVKPITPIDAEVIESSDNNEVESDAPKKQRGGKKKKKKRN